MAEILGEYATRNINIGTRNYPKISPKKSSLRKIIYKKLSVRKKNPNLTGNRTIYGNDLK